MEADVGIPLEEEIRRLVGNVRGIVVCHAAQVVASSLAQPLQKYLQRVRSVYYPVAVLAATARSIHYWGSLCA